MPPTNLDGIRERASKELLEYRKERDKKSRFRRMACEIGEELDVCELCYEPMSIGDELRKCPAKSNALKYAMKKRLLTYNI